VYPCDGDALQLALSGAFAGYLAPVLIGPAARIRDVALRAGLNIGRLLILDTPDDPRAASVQAVVAARVGRVQALVKGNLGIDDLLSPVAAADSGLRTDHRLSYAHVLDIAGRAQPLLVADALLNVAPNLAAKKDILHNTVELARALGIAAPRVALLAAVDGVNHAFTSTMDASALKTMAAHGLFGEVEVDGPFAADTALSAEAARANGVHSTVAGRPEIVLAPSMEAASVLLRSITALTGAFATGVVLGARVPIVAAAKGDAMDVRMAACVVAALLATPRAVPSQVMPALLPGAATEPRLHARS